MADPMRTIEYVLIGLMVYQMVRLWWRLNRRRVKKLWQRVKDHILILSEKHVRRVIREFCAFFNHARPHQGIDQQIPIPSYDVDLPAHARREVIGVPVLNGLHHNYQWAA